MALVEQGIKLLGECSIYFLSMPQLTSLFRGMAKEAVDLLAQGPRL